MAGGKGKGKGKGSGKDKIKGTRTQRSSSSPTCDDAHDGAHSESSSTGEAQAMNILPYVLPDNWYGAVAAFYEEHMFGDEMRDELEFRGVPLEARTYNRATMARMLEEADDEENYGRGVQRSYRVIEDNMAAKRRPGNYEYPEDRNDEEE